MITAAARRVERVCDRAMAPFDFDALLAVGHRYRGHGEPSQRTLGSRRSPGVNRSWARLEQCTLPFLG
jgi:hypothetical protein